MDKISPIKERILQFIETHNIAKTDFCEKTGISYANMKGKSLQSEIGGTQIGEILSTYSQISAEWLLTGKGQMLKFQTENSNLSQAAEPEIPYHVKGKTCALCIEKDEKIGFLKKMLDDKDKIIALLEKQVNSK